jgi:DNA-binding transcriptional MocR family regulator
MTHPGGRRVIDDIAGAIDDRSARGIASAISRLVSSGEIAAGTRLPTVRSLSRALGVSPTTVSEAWRSLAAIGAIDARGRQGTFVGTPTGRGVPRRYRRVTEGPGHFAVDLSTGTPDPALLPDLSRAVARVARQNLTSSYLDSPVLPALRERLAADWPFPAEAITVVDGAMDALDRIAREVVRMGDRVVVEHPTFPPFLDLLDHLGAEIIGIEVDDEGMTLEPLAAALAARPVAVVIQPRAHNPTGVAMSPRRCRAIARLLAGSNAIVIEDDHSAGIATAPLASLGTALPSRTVHVRSYSKSLGPDLRLAAVGGSGDVVNAVANRRMLGPGWSSRILQSVLVGLLDDPSTAEVLDTARDRYAHRRRLAADALDAAGVGYTRGDGVNLWVQVADERSAAIALAAQGIGVAPGEPFLTRPDGEHIRVTVGLLAGSDHEIRAIAAGIARAAAAVGGRTALR